MESERYCNRCGEDALDIYRCDRCGTEFCTDCMSRREYEDQVCEKCIDRVEAAETKATLVAFANRVLPCMRQWVLEHFR